MTARYILPVLRDVRRINPQLQVMGSPWSAPAWMKTNGQLVGISQQQKAAGATNRLKAEHIPTYASYLLKACQAYADQGLPLDALTLQNEPQFDAARYPCMRMTVDDQIQLVRALGPQLRAAGLKTQIYVHDHNWVLHENDRRVIGGDRKQPPLDAVTQILSDPQVAPYVAGSAWHCYSGNRTDMQRVYSELRTRFPDQDICCTEATGWGRRRGAWWGDMQWGLAHNWLGGLAAGASVALQWNLALDRQFGPTLRDDSEALGLVTIDTDRWQDVQLQREYYAMAHVSLAAQPQSQLLRHRVLATEAVAGAEQVPLEVLAVRQVDGARATVVVNTADRPVDIQVACEGQGFRYSLPGHALATFRWPASGR